MIIGVTGLAGSGKSSFCRRLCQRWGTWINADELGHQVLQMSCVIEDLKTSFGNSIVLHGQVCRKTLAAKALATEESVKRLNEITHPHIRERIRELCLQEECLGRFSVVDAALLFEAAFVDLPMIGVMIDAPLESRVARVSSRGWSLGDLKTRDFVQNEKLKRDMADVILDGSVSLARLYMNADWLEASLRRSIAMGDVKRDGVVKWMKRISMHSKKRFELECDQSCR